MSGQEVFLVQELTDALAGRPLKTAAYRDLSARKGAMERSLDSAKAGGNWAGLAMAVALVRAQALPDLLAYAAEWLAYYAASRDAFMGDEGAAVSRIYGTWHLTFNLVAAQVFTKVAADRPDQPALAQARDGALDWLAFWWHLMVLLEAPDGQILAIGQRSGGHAPKPGWFEYFLARARGDAGQISRALAWLHAAGAGPEHSDNMVWIRALEGTIKSSYRRAMGMPRPDFGMRLPLTVVRNDAGIAAWIGNDPPDYPYSCRNGNTTPIVGVTWEAGIARYLPDRGGNRVREKFDSCLCWEEGGSLHYTSPFNAAGTLPMPGGGVGERTVIFRPGSAPGSPSGSPAPPAPPSVVPPTPPAPPPAPAPTPPPSGRTAGVIAADVMRLQAAGKDRSRLREIAMEISGAIKSWRSWNAVADDLLSLGPQHADVRALADEVRRMGA